MEPSGTGTTKDTVEAAHYFKKKLNVESLKTGGITTDEVVEAQVSAMNYIKEIGRRLSM